MTKKINSYLIIILLFFNACAIHEEKVAPLIKNKPIKVAPKSARPTPKIKISSRNIQHIMSDENLVKAIQLKIHNTPEINRNSAIRIGAFDGSVLMYGWTKDKKTQRKIQKIISPSSILFPIRKVYNHLSTQPQETTLEASNCSWASTKATTALLTSTALTTRHIQIFCYKKTMFILGRCYDKERDVILRIIKKKSGDRKIITHLETLKQDK